MRYGSKNYLGLKLENSSLDLDFCVLQTQHLIININILLIP